jgi:NTE family protein
MPSIGLVLSAGGAPGRAYHAGTLAGIFHETGWDARDASLVIGTSAGSSAAAFVRAGLAPADDLARYTGADVSPEGQELLARVHEPGPVMAPLPGPSDGRLLRPSLALRGLTCKVAPLTALSGLLPRGQWDGESMGRRVRDVWGNAWPEEPTWLCAVRVRDGRRVVFGRDDVPTPDIGTASQASCAVPRVVQPVRIGRDEFIDGATHSSTNADLCLGLAFDLVVVVSSMTAVPSVASRALRAPSIIWYSRQLAREVERLRAAGTEVLVVQPTRVDLDVRRGEASLPAIAAHAAQTARANLARPGARRARELLCAAALASPRAAGVTDRAGATSPPGAPAL